MRIRLHLKIFIFIFIFIITRQIKIYGFLMFFAFLHEIGHMVAGIVLGFKPSKLEIMPFGLSIGFEGKVDNYNKKIGKTSILIFKKMIIAFAGPLVNILFVIIFSVFNIKVFNIERELIVYANLLIGIFNLIPIYPLDGGRVIKYAINIFCGNKDAITYINKISYITIIILTAIGSILILYLKNIAFLVILAYLWYLVIKENKRYEKKIRLYEKIMKIKEESTVN